MRFPCSNWGPRANLGPPPPSLQAPRMMKAYRANTGLEASCAPPQPIGLADKLRTELLAFQAQVRAYAEAHPSVAGVSSITKRSSRDLDGIGRLEALQRSGTIDEATLVTRLHGVRNNLQGLRAELSVAQSAPGVCALGRRIHVAASDRVGHMTTVETDCVALDGLLWIEVKGWGADGAGSAAFDGPSRGRGRPAREQAQELLRAARAAPRRWYRTPMVAFHFWEEDDIKTATDNSACGAWEELESMGVYVSRGPRFDASRLPFLKAPRPTLALLDVSTLCALCSQVSYGGAAESDVQQWASKVPQHGACLQLEIASPLLPKLQGQLEGCGLVSLGPIVGRMDDLVAAFGGPRERARWGELRGRLRIEGAVVRGGGGADSMSTAVTALAEEAGEPDRSVEEPGSLVLAGGGGLVAGPCVERDRLLKAAGREEALLVTANSGIAEEARERGVEIWVHRAVWLTGT